MSSNLPPSITNAMIDAHFASSSCTVCGTNADDCECPECPFCGEAGDISCYILDWLDNPVIHTKEAPYNGHKMRLSPDQMIGQAKLHLYNLKSRVDEQKMYIDWLINEKHLAENDGI